MVTMATVREMIRKKARRKEKKKRKLQKRRRLQKRNHQIISSCKLCPQDRSEHSAKQTIPVISRHSCVQQSAKPGSQRRTRRIKVVSLTAAANVKPLASVSSHLYSFILFSIIFNLDSPRSCNHTAANMNYLTKFGRLMLQLYILYATYLSRPILI